MLLIDVLKGLGGASQEKSAARNFLTWFNKRARKTEMSVALFYLDFENKPTGQIGPMLSVRVPAVSLDPFAASFHRC